MSKEPLGPTYLWVYSPRQLMAFQEQSECFPVGMIYSFFFVSYDFYLFLPSMGWLCGVGVFGLMEFSHSLQALHSRLQIIIIIITASITLMAGHPSLHSGAIGSLPD